LSPRVPAGPVLLLVLMLLVLAVSATASGEGEGKLRGVVTIVGDDTISEGEVVVSFAGSNASAGTTDFSSADPAYSIDLPPGDYTVYAWAKVHHNSERTSFSVRENATTWVNLTVVRIEEILGAVTDPAGDPVGGAVLQFSRGGTIVGTSTTDDQGRFRDLLDPGTYRLRVTKSAFYALERDVTISEGQVLELDLELDPIPPEEEEEAFPWYTLVIAVFVVMVAGLSVGHMNRQARRLRRAAAEAEAARSRDMLCPECGGSVPEGETRCPSCSYVFQVRCDECGRSMDAGTPVCPECGNPMD